MTTRPDLQVRDFIVAAIRAGTYRANGKLPAERALSQQLGVPRSAVLSRCWRAAPPRRGAAPPRRGAARSLPPRHHLIVAALKARNSGRAEAALLGHPQSVRGNLLGR